jgi:hypothetical protein
LSCEVKDLRQKLCNKNGRIQYYVVMTIFDPRILFNHTEKETFAVNGYGPSYLENVWRAGGTDRLKRTFGDMARRDRAEALRLINDERLRFPILFVLMAEIGSNNLYDGLSKRNLTALNICTKKIYNHSIGAAEVADDGDRFQALKWMFSTGRDWEGPSEGRDPYDAVIDYAAALLITEYEDKTVLKDVTDLIFRRNRQGYYIHDLAWSFFQSLDYDALAATAGYLLSDNPRDVELAEKLLGIDADALRDRDGARRAHRQYIGWLNENKPYLYLTGEHFQLTSNPKHLDADREARYLGKEISPRSRAPIEPLTENEAECLHRFREAPPEEQEELSAYSGRLRARDARLWNEWIQKKPEQAAAARMTREAT